MSTHQRQSSDHGWVPQQVTINPVGMPHLFDADGIERSGGGSRGAVNRYPSTFYWWRP
jgi:hypothetical protein